MLGVRLLYEIKNYTPIYQQAFCVANVENNGILPKSELLNYQVYVVLDIALPNDGCDAVNSLKKLPWKRICYLICVEISGFLNTIILFRTWFFHPPMLFPMAKKELIKCRETLAKSWEIERKPRCLATTIIVPDLSDK